MQDLVGRLRRFNRVHSRLVGTLDKDYLETDFSLQEARVLFEVATRRAPAARDVQDATGFDQGYTSRLVARLSARGLVRRQADARDRRSKTLILTPKGRGAFEDLNARADRRISALVAPLTPDARARLAGAVATIEGVLGPPSPPPKFTIRRRKVGDLGWTFYRQAVVYRDEFGYDDVFETFVCQGLAPFLGHLDPARDELWVAEAEGAPLGFIAIHHDAKRPGWAKLRWFLVEKEARGRGVGRALLDEALGFARAARYKGVLLTTVSDLADARRQYERAGFRLVHEERCPWKAREREQRWELRLSARTNAR